MKKLTIYVKKTTIIKRHKDITVLGIFVKIRMSKITGIMINKISSPATHAL